MLSLVRVNQGNNVLEAYTETDTDSQDDCYPEFKVSFSASATPRYAILARDDDNNFDNLTGYDTLKECIDHITNLVESRS